MKTPSLLLFAATSACSPALPDHCEAPGTVCTFAGVPQTALSGTDDILARLSGLYYPTEVILDERGRVYVLDLNNHRLRYVDPRGDIHTAVGTGFAGVGDAGLALEVDIGGPSDAVIDSDGALVFSLRSSNRIERFDPATGRVEVVAGNGWRGFGGDGGPAVAALLQAPMSVALDTDGTLLIADTDNNLIRQVAGGDITTLAGSWPNQGYAGDAGSAVEAALNRPTGLLRRGDQLYFADSGNHMIRVIDLETGRIERVAGLPGEPGASDGPALEARFSWPADLTELDDGTLLIADEFNHCLRALSPEGEVSTFAGQCGESGYGGDGGDRRDALFYAPLGVTVGPEGYVYVADTANHLVRRIAP